MYCKYFAWGGQSCRYYQNHFESFSESMTYNIQVEEVNGGSIPMKTNTFYVYSNTIVPAYSGFFSTATVGKSITINGVKVKIIAVGPSPIQDKKQFTVTPAIFLTPYKQTVFGLPVTSPPAPPPVPNTKYTIRIEEVNGGGSATLANFFWTYSRSTVPEHGSFIDAASIGKEMTINGIKVKITGISYSSIPEKIQYSFMPSVQMTPYAMSDIYI